MKVLEVTGHRKQLQGFAFAEKYGQRSFLEEGYMGKILLVDLSKARYAVAGRLSS